MKVNEFITVVNKEKNKKVGAILEVKKYLPIAEKRDIAQKVINVCVTDVDGVLVMDSVTKYTIFTMFVISKYTNLEFDTINDYDLLCEADLLNPVIETFATEYARVNEILNMMIGDLMRTNSLEVAAMSMLSKLSDNLDIITLTLSNKIDEVNIDLEKIDFKKISSIMEILKNPTK